MRAVFLRTQNAKVHPKKFNFISNIQRFDKSFHREYTISVLPILRGTQSTEMRCDALRCDDIAQFHFDIHEFAMSLMDTIFTEI